MMAPEEPSQSVWLRWKKTSNLRTTTIVRNRVMMLLLAGIVAMCWLAGLLTAAAGRDGNNHISDLSDEVHHKSSLLKRFKRDNSGQEPQLFRRKRTKEAAADEELHREKRTGIDDHLGNLERVLSREKRTDEEEELSRVKRLSAEDEVHKGEAQELSRQKRKEGEDELFRVKRLSAEDEVQGEKERELSRQKRGDEEKELFRAKRLSAENKIKEEEESELSRQKRNEDEGEFIRELPTSDLSEPEKLREERELSRQKRQETEGLSRQKRTYPAWVQNIQENKNQDGPLSETEQTLSRQKRDIPETPYNRLSETEQTLSRQKRDIPETPYNRLSETEQTLSRQKRDIPETPYNRLSETEQTLSRQKRDIPETPYNRLSETEQTLSRQKRDIPETPYNRLSETEQTLSRQKRDIPETPYNRLSETEQTLSRQKRDIPETPYNRLSETEQTLSRQKRDIPETPYNRKKRDLSRATKTESENGNVQNLAKRKGKGPSVKFPERLLRQEAELLERIKYEPEHKLYNEDLLVRRMKSLHTENKLRKRNKLPDIIPEDEDSWDRELRIRDELAEKAIEYGIQQHKERMRNPDPNRPLTLSERIKKEAEEILKRRKEEQKSSKEKTVVKTEIRQKGEKEERNREEEKEIMRKDKPGRTKTMKAIRNILQANNRKKGSSSLQIASETNADKETGSNIAEQKSQSKFDDNILRFETMFPMGKERKKDRLKMRKHNKAIVQEMNRRQREAYYRSIGLPLLRVPDTYTIF